MILLEPSQDVVSELAGQFVHLGCLTIRYQPGLLVPADVPFLAEGIEATDESWRGADCQAKRLYDPKVVLIARRPVSAGGECQRGRLERGIAGNVETPVGAEIVTFGVLEIAIDER